MQRGETLNQIRKELAIAEEAQKGSNTGMVRVCANAPRSSSGWNPI